MDGFFGVRGSIKSNWFFFKFSSIHCLHQAQTTTLIIVFSQNKNNNLNHLKALNETITFVKIKRRETLIIIGTDRMSKIHAYVRFRIRTHSVHYYVRRRSTCDWRTRNNSQTFLQYAEPTCTHTHTHPYT